MEGLGTWNTLTEAMDEQVIGKGIIADGCENVHIINEMNIPILCVGMDNVVVSASPEGILVADKERSTEMKRMWTTSHSRLCLRKNHGESIVY